MNNTLKEQQPEVNYASYRNISGTNDEIEIGRDW